jgi:hypothetical protein
MHFYTKINGKVETRHLVANASKGGLRASRVTDAKKAAKQGETWLPSTTTILGVLDKPALKSWFLNQHLQTVYDTHLNEAIESDDFTGWSKQIKAKTQEALDAAPSAGTAIHDVLEHFVCKGIEPTNPIELLICNNVKDILMEKCGVDDWDCHPFLAEESFCSDIGYAGCADLVSDTETESWVIDYKSKQTSSAFTTGKKMVYPEHVRQLASYAKALIPGCEFDTVRCANIFVNLESGDVIFYEHESEKLKSGWLDFISCLDIFKRNSYNPTVDINTPLCRG